MSRKGNIGQTNIELRNIEALALHEENILWLVIVKGNLRHRIDLLGVEQDQELLSEPQRVLRAQSSSSAQAPSSSIAEPHKRRKYDQRDVPLK